ncbi:hypothetical protein Enr13x_37950 [Stieleria neptunia]|uniref:Uncharacterized protein n=1 Tax=Stieleria neptunia TaxID=2527979 RepID=A0A518HSW2_9BACT|nr:hypothetical protein [Stieleria neptunia]QDV43935.1 hypothetical protein Enr13x_37950 [Stieleria neptunia]
MDEDRARLQRFIKSATEVYESRYAQELQQPISVSVHFNLKEGFAESSRTGPDEESVKAAILTLRFFCQDNEDISMRNMAAFTKGLSVNQSLKDEFETIRDEFNAYLDRDHGPPIFKIGGHTIRNREIFEAFMYGKYAHLTKHEIVAGWETLIQYDGMRAGFDRVLRQFVQTLVWLRTVCEKMDAELAAQNAAQQRIRRRPPNL